jgi:hypothetical protein
LTVIVTEVPINPIIQSRTRYCFFTEIRTRENIYHDLRQRIYSHTYITVYSHTFIQVFFFTGSTAPLGPGLCFPFHDHFTDGRTPWASDQLVERPLPKHRIRQIQNKHIHTPNIHAFCGIRTHDSGFRASEDSSCLRPLGYRDRLILVQVYVTVK